MWIPESYLFKVLYICYCHCHASGMERRLERDECWINPQRSNVHADILTLPLQGCRWTRHDQVSCSQCEQHKPRGSLHTSSQIYRRCYSVESVLKTDLRAVCIVIKHILKAEKILSIKKGS